jgi:formate hydrogenlyase subunit 3/multisubunit Na+/H+ antiporter MnhD subunit
MNYIIDPMWVYWVNVVDWLKGAVLAIAIITTVVAFLRFVTAMADKDWDSESENKQKMKCARVLAVIAVIAFICSAFIPSKQTLIEMQVAKFATYENAEWTVETIKQAVDYIAEAIGSLK